MSDVKMEIVLSAKNASDAAFRSVAAYIKELGSSVFSLKSTIAGLGIGFGFGAIAKSVLDTASSFEQMELKLDTLTKGRGKQTLSDITLWAKDLPISVKDATDSFVMMQAYGLNPTQKTFQTLVDTASVLGDDALPRISRALGQIASRGKLSAQELMQLSEVGVNATRYLREAFGMNVEQVQESGIAIEQVIDVIWRGLDADYAGGAKRAMNSWKGLTVQWQKNIENLERQVAQAGLFDALKEGLGYVNQAMSDWIKNNQELLRQDLPRYFRELTDAAKAFFEVAALPSVTGTLFEGQKMIAKGLIDSEKFYYAGFVERNRMLENAKKLEATNQNISTRSGYQNAPGVAIPAGYRENLTGTYFKAVEKDAKGAKSAVDDYLKTASGMVSFGEWEDDYNKLEALRLEVIKTRDAASKFDMEAFGKVLRLEVNKTHDAASKFDIEAFKKASEGDIRRLEKEIPLLQKEGWDEQINDIVDSVDSGFKSMIELSERTAEAMQENFSDLFFDAFTGKLKSIEDYAKAVFTSIQRAAADMAGQMAAEALFGSMKSGKAGQGGTGGLIGSFLALFTGGGPEQLGQYAMGAAFGRGLQRFADGGVVSRPTVFRFASGAGLMGEDGPEAIMPLKRLPGGRLGVEAAASSGNITVNVQAPRGRLDRDSLSELQASIYTAMARSARRNT